VAKTAAAVATVTAAAATVAMAAADNSRTGGQDISIAVWGQLPWSSLPLALLSSLLSLLPPWQHAVIGDNNKSCGGGRQRRRTAAEDNLQKDGGLVKQRGTGSEIVIV
jgi:hypothetical protein